MEVDFTKLSKIQIENQMSTKHTLARHQSDYKRPWVLSLLQAIAFAEFVLFREKLKNRKCDFLFLNSILNLFNCSVASLCEYAIQY